MYPGGWLFVHLQNAGLYRTDLPVLGLYIARDLFPWRRGKFMPCRLQLASLGLLFFEPSRASLVLLVVCRVRQARLQKTRHVIGCTTVGKSAGGGPVKSPIRINLPSDILFSYAAGVAGGYTVSEVGP